MKRVNEIILRELISPADIITKKFQKLILGGYHSLCSAITCNGSVYICQCVDSVGLFVTCNKDTAGKWCASGEANCNNCQ